MAITMTKFKEPVLKKPEPKRLAIYGEAMSGKTTFAGKADKPFFLSFDNNALDAGYNGAKPESYDDVITIIESAGKYGYNTIVLDTVEDMLDTLTDEITNKNNVESLDDVPGQFKPGYAELNKKFNSIIHKLSQSDLKVYYLMRAQQTETGMWPVLKEKRFSVVSGYADGLIEISSDHKAKWVKKRYQWDEKDLTTEPLNEIIDPEKQRNEKLKELGL